MINGTVKNLQILVPVTFVLPARYKVVLEFVVDTGFEGALTLPIAAVATLQLPYFSELDANLANDSSTKTDVHIATILWNGQEQEVAVLAMGRRPLLGTALLEGKHLGSDFVEGGVATIVDL